MEIVTTAISQGGKRILNNAEEWITWAEQMMQWQRITAQLSVQQMTGRHSYSLPSQRWVSLWRKSSTVLMQQHKDYQILLENCSGKRPNKITGTSSNVSYGKWKINHLCRVWALESLHSKERKALEGTAGQHNSTIKVIMLI